MICCDLLVGLILLTDTEFITVCVGTFYSSSVDKESFILHSYLTNGRAQLMWHSTEQSWNLLHILHPTVLPKGCEPQVLRESRCNILFMYHISKSPATCEKAITEFKPFAFVHSHSSLMKSLGNCHYHPCQKEKKKKANPPICVSAPGQCVQPQRKRRCSFDDMSEGDLRGTAA